MTSNAVSTFSAWTRKEFLEGVRSYRFVIVAGTFAFFAAMDPVMLRLMPVIMKAQAGVDLGALVPATRDFAFGSFLGDLFEIGTLVACLVLGGSVARERKGREYAIPATKGARFGGIVAAKILVGGGVSAAAAAVATLCSYFYAGVLFPGTQAEPAVALVAAANLAGYFAWVAALAVLASALFSSSAPASLAAAAAAYGLPALAGLVGVARFLPPWLATGSSDVAALPGRDFGPALLSAFAAVVLSWLLAKRALERAEL